MKVIISGETKKLKLHKPEAAGQQKSILSQTYM